MKTLLMILLIVSIIAVAVFTGSWIFDIVAFIFRFIEKFFGICAKGSDWLAAIFNIFGWNNGLIGG